MNRTSFISAITGGTVYMPFNISHMQLLSQRVPALLLCLGITSLGPACKNTHYDLPDTFIDDTTINAVIEIPAGTNRKIEFQTATGTFETDRRNGQDRIIRYLPYPANYGFIPRTLSAAGSGGDGDALDILVISEALQTGTIISVNPIALLQLNDNGEEDFKIIAVPADPLLNILGSCRPDDIRNMESIRQIITTWFLHYDTDPAAVTGWGSKEDALRYIRNNTVSEP